MLTAAQHKARENKLTASAVACLMNGDEQKILNLWRLLVGDPDYVPDDLSHIWPVRLGEATEALNLEWYTYTMGTTLSRMGEVVVGVPDWMACTLDGWDDVHGMPVECKHVGGGEPLETIIARYQPQLHWQMMVTKAQRCALSVIMGTNEPVVEQIKYDDAYADELMKRALAFMRCVENMIPPVAFPSVTPPVPAVKTYDMRGNNEWASSAAVWIENREQAKKFEVAAKSIKALVQPDAIKCHGHGIIVNRSKAGSLSIKEYAS